MTRGASLFLPVPGFASTVFGSRMNPPRLDAVPAPAVRRLSLYLRQLESFSQSGRRTISSKQLGDSLNFTDAQVRKDLAYFGQFGHPGIGYRVDELIAQGRKIMGTDKTWNVLLVGAGNLGRALMAYRGFDAKGFRLAAVFDNDPGKAGDTMAGFKVRPLSDLADTVKTPVDPRRHPCRPRRGRPERRRPPRRRRHPRSAELRPGQSPGAIGGVGQRRRPGGATGAAKLSGERRPALNLGQTR